MTIKLAVLRETGAGERRVAKVPAVVERADRPRGRIFERSGAGYTIKMSDRALKNAEIIADAALEAWSSIRNGRRIALVRRGDACSVVVTFLGPCETVEARDGN